MLKKVLVVEDEKIDAVSIGRVIKEHFPSVSLEIVTNGEQALDWIQRFRQLPNESVYLVLMDLTVPRISGLDLVAEFKKHPYLGHAPIVILSGSDNPKAIRSAYDSGACGYLVKPSTYAQMNELLTKTLTYWLDANQLSPT